MQRAAQAEALLRCVHAKKHQVGALVAELHHRKTLQAAGPTAGFTTGFIARLIHHHHQHVALGHQRGQAARRVAPGQAGFDQLARHLGQRGRFGDAGQAQHQGTRTKRCARFPVSTSEV